MKSKTRIENLSGINDYLLQNDELNDNMKSKTRIENQSGINDYLPQNDELIKINDFNKALDVNQQALSISENGQRLDKVLFNIGFIYAHHDNPDKNYKLSIEYFERLIKEYPQSPLIDQAKVWQGLLNIIEKSKQVDIEIDQKKKELAR
jgi:tetratricopeptide (TPR) repeat protein